MQLPMLSGIRSGPQAEFIQTFPLNLEPVPINSKISKGQFRTPPGAREIGIGPGRDRGGIVWNDRHYRVLGTKLVEIGSDGSLVEIGDVGGGERCTLDYGFDRLGIWSGGDLFYYDGSSLIDVTDDDLERAIDGIWIDGYFMSTDGTYVVVTELSDPTSILPLKYGSAESDPDAITGLMKYREEAYVFGRNTIQVLRNVGGNGFPFEPVRGGTIPFGCVSPSAKCRFGDGFAFVGSARGDALNVFAGGAGQAQPFGNKAVCDALALVIDPTSIELECRSYGGEQRLLVHTPDESWCFLENASRLFGEPVWYRLSSGENYRIRNAVEVYGRQWVGDTRGGRYGYLDFTDSRHWGQHVEQSFDAGMLYSQGQSVIVHSVELVGLPGRGTGRSTMFMSMTRDGETYTQERAITVDVGERLKRIQWRPHARLANYMGFRFRIVGGGLAGIAACEINAGM